MSTVVPTSEWPYRDRLPRAPMDAPEVLRLVQLLQARGLTVWLDGGWGVDALLEEQVREHDDLDLVVEMGHVAPLIEVMTATGYQVVAGGVPKSFVLVDAIGRQVDVHPVLFDEDRGGGVYLRPDGLPRPNSASSPAGVGEPSPRLGRCRFHDPDREGRNRTAQSNVDSSLFRRWPALKGAELSELRRLYDERLRLAKSLGARRQRDSDRRSPHAEESSSETGVRFPPIAIAD